MQRFTDIDDAVKIRRVLKRVLPGTSMNVCYDKQNGAFYIRIEYKLPSQTFAEALCVEIHTHEQYLAFFDMCYNLCYFRDNRGAEHEQDDESTTA